MAGTGDTGRQGAAWAGPFTIGLLLVVLGLGCVVAAFPAGVASILLVGGFLIVGGALELVHGARAGDRRARPWLWLGGVLSIVVGALMLMRPVAGLASLTLLLAAYFFANSLFRLIGALADRYPGWGSDALYGVVTLVLGIVVVGSWPLSSLWVVGTLVGAEILVRGVALMSASLLVRRLLHAHSAA